MEFEQARAREGARTCFLSIVRKLMVRKIELPFLSLCGTGDNNKRIQQIKGCFQFNQAVVHFPIDYPHGC